MIVLPSCSFLEQSLSHGPCHPQTSPSSNLGHLQNVFGGPHNNLNLLCLKSFCLRQKQAIRYLDLHNLFAPQGPGGILLTISGTVSSLLLTVTVTDKQIRAKLQMLIMKTKYGPHKKGPIEMTKQKREIVVLHNFLEISKNLFPQLIDLLGPLRHNQIRQIRANIEHFDIFHPHH